MKPRIDRRKFLHASTTLAVATLSNQRQASGEQNIAPKSTAFNTNRIVGFTKPLIGYSFTETAAIAIEVGWDGIDCPIRNAHTHIQPERVTEDLPRFVDALAAHQLSIDIVSTDIWQLDDASEKMLNAIARSGIKRYRLGFRHYEPSIPIEQTLSDYRSRLIELDAFNRQLGLQAGIQNHSGASYIGGPIWDVWSIIKDLETVGIIWDYAHAIIEGSQSWPIQQRLTKDKWMAVTIKDFQLHSTHARVEPVQWCNLGIGELKAALEKNGERISSTGLIIQHHEQLENRRVDRGQLIRILREDLTKLRAWVEDSRHANASAN